MKRSFHAKSLALLSLLAASILLLAACGGASQSGGAAAAIEAYNQALVDRDANRVSNLSCSAWEAEARNELNSFGSVTARLVDASCQESGADGDYTLVSCSGSIIANYNGEDLEIKLSERTYQAVREGGEWRMCGYR